MRRGKLAAAVAALLALTAPAAHAQTATLSGSSPLGRCTPLRDVIPQRGSEAEPHLAASRDGRLLVATWQQDRYRTRGALAAGVTVSRDGGLTWQPSFVPGATTCPPRGEDFSSDPWVSVGADGTLYLAHLTGAGAGAEEATRSRIAVHRSFDEGRTWTGRSYVPSPRGFADKESLTADPYRPGLAYVVWRQVDREPLFSRTTDHGATWSRPVRLPAGESFTNLVLGVLPDGALLVVGRDGGDAFQQPRILATRSTDGGARWSRPVRLPAGDFFEPELIMPDFPPIRTGLATSFSVAADGAAWVAWTGVGTRGPQVSVARSRDGGRTWRRTASVRSPGAVFTPAVAAASRDSAALTWYDQRADRRTDRAFTTRIRIARTTSGGAAWADEPLTGGFDFRRAPETGGAGALFLGDYTGLVALPGGRYGAAVTIARATGGRRGRSDVRFVAR